MPTPPAPPLAGARVSRLMMTFCTKSHLKFCIFRNPTESGTWESHSSAFITLHGSHLLPIPPPRFHSTLSPNGIVKTQKAHSFFFSPLPHRKAHVPSRVPTQIACRDDGHRTDAACAREIIIEHGAGRTTMTLSSTTRSRHPSSQAVDFAASGSLSLLLPCRMPSVLESYSSLPSSSLSTRSEPGLGTLFEG